MLLNCGVGEDSWESLGLQGDQTSQSGIFIVRTDAEAETPILWPPNAKNWLISKGPDAGKDWRQEKGMTEDEMVGWYHWLNRHEFEQALGVGDGQASLACCSPWVVDRQAWRAAVHGLWSQTRLRDWTDWTELFTLCCCAYLLPLCPTLRACGLQPTRLLCPWDSPCKNIGVGCHPLHQGIFLTQGANPGLPRCRWPIYHLSHQGSPRMLEYVFNFKRKSQNIIQNSCSILHFHL